MKKIVSIAMIFGLLLLASMLLSPHAQAASQVASPLPSPYSTIVNPYQLTEYTIEQAPPATVDPAAAYDTASGQLVQQVYDTLIMCNGEHLDQFVPNLAVQAERLSVSTEGAQTYPVTMNSAPLKWSSAAVTQYLTPDTSIEFYCISGDTVTFDLTNPSGQATNSFTIPGLGVSSGSIAGGAPTKAVVFTAPYVDPKDIGNDYNIYDINGKIVGTLQVLAAVPANVAYYSLPYWYVYSFTLRTDAPWQNMAYGNVTAGDVAYSYKREMILDYSGGPQWMMNEPLLGTAAGVDAFNIGTISSPGPDAATVGHMIDDAVQYNNTMHMVWLNIAFDPVGTPSSYGPEMDILTQTWSSVLCENWINNYVIPLGKAVGPSDPDFGKVYPVIDWNGSFGPTYTQWLDAHFAIVAPGDLDYGFAGAPPGALMMGSGPFSLFYLNYAGNYWTVWRFAKFHEGTVGNQMVNPETGQEYPQGWPAPWPAVAGTAPAGYVDNFTENWNYVWTARYSAFLAGQCDIVAVPRQDIPQLYKSGSPPYNPPSNFPLNGIRCINPLPELEVDGMFFQFAVSPSTPYGVYNPNGTYSAGAIPYDFFGNSAYGLDTRLAFAYAIDYNTFITSSYLGEAYTQTSTPYPISQAIIPGLTGYDPSVKGYNFNLTKTADYLYKTPAWTSGFTITICYNTGNIPRQNLATMLQTNLESLNTVVYDPAIGKMPGPITVITKGIAWGTEYIPAMIEGQLSVFVIGWLADYPDVHDFAAPFYSAYAGVYATWQGYYDPAMETLIIQDIKAAPSARQAVDTAIEKLAVADCSFVATDQPTGRLFERDWVVGWYFNQLYPDIYAYNLWKWYYVPQAGAALAGGTGPGVVQPYADYNPTDTNYDGHLNMKDVAVFTSAFGTSYGPPIPSRWVFRADINNDRKINMGDAAYIAGSFGKSSLVWVPPP